MLTKTETVTPQKVLELARALSPDDLTWLVDQIHHFTTDLPLPESTSLEEAVTLFPADQCSLGRAAEIAGVTRWDIIDDVSARNMLVHQDSEMTSEEMESQFEQLKAMGIL